jgi:hypothetical protein
MFGMVMVMLAIASVSVDATFWKRRAPPAAPQPTKQEVLEQALRMARDAVDRKYKFEYATARDSPKKTRERTLLTAIGDGYIAGYLPEVTDAASYHIFILLLENILKTWNAGRGVRKLIQTSLTCLPINMASACIDVSADEAVEYADVVEDNLVLLSRLLRGYPKVANLCLQSSESIKNIAKTLKHVEIVYASMEIVDATRGTKLFTLETLKNFGVRLEFGDPDAIKDLFKHLSPFQLSVICPGVSSSKQQTTIGNHAYDDGMLHTNSDDYTPVYDATTKEDCKEDYDFLGLDAGTVFWSFLDTRRLEKQEL